MNTDYETNKTKYLLEYLEYFILTVEKSNLEQKWFFTDQLNEFKTWDFTNEYVVLDMLRGLRMAHSSLYNDKKIDFLDYSNYYRCREFDMPIK